MLGHRPDVALIVESDGVLAEVPDVASALPRSANEEPEPEVSVEDLVRYARAVDGLAAEEVASLPDRRSRGQVVEHMVVGTVLFEAVLTALRLLAQEHHSVVRFAERTR